MADLDVKLEQIQRALKGFAANTSGGFLELNSREYLIRNIGRTSRLPDLERLAVGVKHGQPILLSQVAVKFAPAIKRGDAGYDAGPAVVLGIRSSLRRTRSSSPTIEAALTELSKTLPQGMETPVVTVRQASFIEASISTLEGELLAAGRVVAVVLFLFLGNIRTTLISLTAIPVSILVTVLVFRYFGMSINTMTLGGLTIAIGGLVDDAVVGVENVLRRMKLDRKHAKEHHAPRPGRVDRAGHDGGSVGHRLRHRDHRARAGAAVLPPGWKGGSCCRSPSPTSFRCSPRCWCRSH